MTAKEFADFIAKTLVDHKGEDVVVLDVKGKSSVADYFVIAGGRSMTHTRSLIEYADEAAEKIGVAAIRSDGVKEGRWAVLDFGDVIVHIFNDETRLLYHLEDLWGEKTDGKE